MAGPAVEPASTGPVRVLGVLVPRWAWLLVCVAGIYTCFLSWGILQERVSTRKYQTEGHSEVFGSFIVLNAVQACVATLWALAYGWMRGHPVRRPTRSTALGYLQLGAAASFGAYCGYRSLGYITFPLVILSKSCKLVPVMLVQTIMDRKIYPWQKYLSVTVVTIGVAWFTWLKPGKGDGGGGGGDGDGHGLAWVGLLLVGLNLLLDGFVNAKEGRMFRTEHMTAHDLQLFMNLAQAAIMIVYLVINPVGDNELADAVGFITRHPAAALCHRRLARADVRLPDARVVRVHRPGHHHRHPQDLYHRPLRLLVRAQHQPRAVAGRRDGLRGDLSRVVRRARLPAQDGGRGRRRALRHGPAAGHPGGQRAHFACGQPWQQAHTALVQGNLEARALDLGIPGAVSCIL